jgi:hypothetical protein
MVELVWDSVLWCYNFKRFVVPVQDNKDSDRCVWNISGIMSDRERAKNLKKNFHNRFPEIEP